MKIPVTESMFVDHFNTMGRGSSFSAEARRALFVHFEDFEESSGEQIELDVISICCDWAEHDDVIDVIQEYGITIDDDGMTDNEIEYAVRECLQDKGGDPIIFEKWDRETQTTRRAWLVQAH